MPRRLIFHCQNASYRGFGPTLGSGICSYSYSASRYSYSYSIEPSETLTVRWINRVSGTKPLISCWSVHSRKQFGDSVRENDVIDRKTMDVKSFVIEVRFVHQRPFEYEYEYRFTEYEYEKFRSASLPERSKITDVARNWATIGK